MPAGIARKIWRNFSTGFPNTLDQRLNPLWPQSIPSQKRYLYYSVTKQKFHKKPTFRSFRASFERMRTHTEENVLRQFRMPCVESSLDKLERNVVRQPIQGTFKTSPVAIVVYRKEEFESVPSKQVTEGANPLDEAKQTDETLRMSENGPEKDTHPNTISYLAQPVSDTNCVTPCEASTSKKTCFAENFNPMTTASPTSKKLSLSP